LADAEKYKADDDKQKQRVDAKNKLESYVFGVKQAAEEAPAEKLTEAEKRQVGDKCKQVLNWLENNLLAEQEEYEFKLSEVQKETGPIMMKLHGGGGGAGAAAGGPPPPGGKAGPTVEEVD